MKNPFSRGLETLPVYIAPLSGNEVVAFGDPAALELLGKTIDRVPEFLARNIRTILASSEEMAQTAQQVKGVVLQLTPESQRMLAQYEMVESGGAMLGVLRGANGQFVHQLKFVKPAATVAANLGGLMSGIAVQQQLVAIEKKLDKLQSGIDYLTDEAHAEVNADLGSALNILDGIYKTAMEYGELTDDQWARVANVEHEVKAHQRRTMGHMQGLQEALSEPEASLSDRVERLSKAMDDQHVEFWLGLHIQADLALTRWDGLHTMRQVDKHPDRLEALTETAKSSIEERHRDLVGLAEAVAEFLDAGGHTDGLLERIRIFKRARLNRLLNDLDEMLQAYRGAADDLGYELAPVSEPLALTVGESSAWAVMMGELDSARGVKPGLTALAAKSPVLAPLVGVRAVKKAISRRRKVTPPN